MRIAAINTIVLSVLAFAPLVSRAGEELAQPSLMDPETPAQVVPRPLFNAAAGYDRPDKGRFAEPIGPPGLRRLGPCPGACEVNLYAGRLWLRTELLAWQTKQTYLPPMVTTGDAGTPPADAGALDQPDTSILFGDMEEHDEVRLGGRFTLGWWFTPEQWSGVEAVYFGLGGQDAYARATSNDFPVLARPYTNVTSGQQESQLVAYPGLLDGETFTRADSEVAGAEVLYRQAVYWTPNVRVDLHAGYRHVHLFDRVLTEDFSTSLDAASGYPIDTTIERYDQFKTENDFHGGQLGISTRAWLGCWSVNLVSKFAYGSSLTKNVVRGETYLTDYTGVDPVVTEYDGGVLALPTNSGRIETDDPTWVGELGFTLERQIYNNMRVSFGYTLLYWDTVTRAPGLIQTSINPTQIPPGGLAGDALPEFLQQRTSFWAQGLNASFEYQF